MRDERTGEDLVSIGFVIDLEYADATTSAHDLLQLFKQHPLVKRILDGGERVGWGAKALPGGGWWSMPKLSMPGAVIVGDAGGLVDTVALKGVHHAINSGALAAEAIYAGAQARRAELRGLRGGARAVRQRRASSTACATRASRSRRASCAARRSSTSRSRPKGRLPPGRLAWHRNDERAMFVGSTARSTRSPTASYTFDKLSSVYISGNATRDDAPDHIRVRPNVPRELAETWRWMCPAGVYEIPDDAPGDRQRRRHRQLHQLRAVRRDHRQGRPPDGARGRRRPALPA